MPLRLPEWRDGIKVNVTSCSLVNDTAGRLPFSSLSASRFAL